MTSRIDHYHFHHIEYVLIINLAVFFAAYLLALLWGIPCTHKLWTKAITTLWYYKLKLHHKFKLKINGGDNMEQRDPDFNEQASERSPLVQPVRNNTEIKL